MTSFSSAAARYRDTMWRYEAEMRQTNHHLAEVDMRLDAISKDRAEDKAAWEKQSRAFAAEETTLTVELQAVADAIARLEDEIRQEGLVALQRREKMAEVTAVEAELAAITEEEAGLVSQLTTARCVAAALRSHTEASIRHADMYNFPQHYGLARGHRWQQAQLTRRGSYYGARFVSHEQQQQQSAPATPCTPVYPLSPLASQFHRPERPTLEKQEAMVREARWESQKERSQEAPWQLSERVNDLGTSSSYSHIDRNDYSVWAAPQLPADPAATFRDLASVIHRRPCYAADALGIIVACPEVMQECDAAGNTILHLLCAVQPLPSTVLRMLLEEGDGRWCCVPGAFNNAGLNAFHVACLNPMDVGNEGKCALLAARDGCSVDDCTADGQTASHLVACDDRYIGTMRFLIQAGTDLSLRALVSGAWRTPGEVASDVGRGRARVMQALIAANE